MMAPSTTWTPETAKALIEEMYFAGATYEEIGIVLGITRQRVHQLRVIYKIPSRPWIGPRSPQQVKQMRMLSSARQRAAKNQIPFNIELSDIETPDYCPVLGMPLLWDAPSGGPNSPSLDRIKSELGYTKGNVAVISMRANSLKGNATLEELYALVGWLQRKLGADLSDQPAPSNRGRITQ